VPYALGADTRIANIFARPDGLQVAVNTTCAIPPGAMPHDTGQTMAFFNMQQGDAPVVNSLADQYTISDSYH
jgi:phospholipase C